MVPEGLGVLASPLLRDSLPFSVGQILQLLRTEDSRGDGMSLLRLGNRKTMAVVLGANSEGSQPPCCDVLWRGPRGEELSEALTNSH